MKYIITESRLNEFMNDYMNSWFSSKRFWKHDSFIIVDSHLDEDEYEPVMEYDHEDGRLWVMEYIKNYIMDLFNKTRNEVDEFLKHWFENEFNVNVSYVA
jgi:hypothetical protein